MRNQRDGNADRESKQIVNNNIMPLIVFPCSELVSGKIPPKIQFVAVF